MDMMDLISSRISSERWVNRCGARGRALSWNYIVQKTCLSLLKQITPRARGIPDMSGQFLPKESSRERKTEKVADG